MVSELARAAGKHTAVATRESHALGFGFLCRFAVLLASACTNPLRVTTPGTGGIANSGGAAGTGGVLGTAGGGGSTSAGGTAGSAGIIGTTTTVVSTCPSDVDTQTDDNNCSACGTACTALAPSTAECTAGRCLVTLASRQPLPFGIALDATSVTWVNEGDGTVMRLTPK